MKKEAGKSGVAVTGTHLKNGAPPPGGPGRHLPGIRQIAGNTVMMAVSMAVACWAFWPIYESAQFLLLAAVTVAAGASIAILGGVLRWSGILVAAATLVVYLALGVPLAIPDRALAGILPSPDGLRELLSASGLAWKELLTISLPVGSYQALLVPVFMLVLVGTVTGLSALVRSDRPAAGMLAPIAVFVAGIALGPESTDWPIAKGLVMLVVTIAWHVWLRWNRRAASIRRLALQGPTMQRSEREHRLGAWRAVVAVGVILLAAVTGATAAALNLPAHEDKDVLRSRIVQPFDSRAYASPLAGFRSYLQPDSARSPMLTVSGLPAGQRIRLATLDTYDGIVYTVGSDAISSESGTFTRVPYRFDQSDTTGQRVNLAVTVDGYTGVWVPGAGKLSEIRFTGPEAVRLTDSFFYNDNTGTAAVTSGLSRGDTYNAISVVRPMATQEQLREAVPGTTTLPPLGLVPDELVNVLAGYAPASESPGVRLDRMIDALISNGYVSHGVSDDEPFSRSGHAADRISQLLTDNPMLGDQEQYAVTAALMARQLGFPARVVIGFVPDADSNPPSQVTLTGGDISAWIEVQTAQWGWLSVDPTPEIRDVPSKQPEDPTKVSRPQSVVQPPASEQQNPQNALPPESVQEDDDDAPPEAWLVILAQIIQILGWMALAVVIVLAPFIVIIIAKLRRRRLRRKAPTALQRISGGWQEFEDTVRDHGFKPPGAATRSEVALAVGGMRPLVLASVADRAVFAPFPPSHQEADRVWNAVTDLRGSLAVGKTRWQRIKALVSVRSFDSYHGKRRR